MPLIFRCAANCSCASSVDNAKRPLISTPTKSSSLTKYCLFWFDVPKTNSAVACPSTVPTLSTAFACITVVPFIVLLWSYIIVKSALPSVTGVNLVFWIAALTCAFVPVYATKLELT